MSNEYLKRVIKDFVPRIAFSVPVGENFDTAIDRLMTAGEFIHVTVEDKGTIFGLIYKSWWNPDVIVAQELGWWVEPEHRGLFSVKLFNKFSALAKANGATILLATAQTAVDHDKTCDVYTKLGMQHTETVFFKEL